MDYTAILFEQSGAVATITLNRPEKINCLNQRMLAEMRDALARVADPGSGVRCLLVTGAGRGFCSGADIGESLTLAGGAIPDLGAILESSYEPVIRAMRALEMPVVCAVNGVASGAGVGLALACDIILAARSAAFDIGFARIGLAADAGTTWMLPRLVGLGRALAMTILAEPVTAAQAEDWGLVWRSYEDAELMPAARAMAAKLAGMPTQALAFSKRALQASTSNDLDAQLGLERDLQRIAGRGADFREGIAAFLEKRAPKFTGK